MNSQPPEKIRNEMKPAHAVPTDPTLTTPIATPNSVTVIRPPPTQLVTIVVDR